MTKVLIITTFYEGGIQTFISELAKNLNDFNFIVFTTKKKFGQRAKEISGNIRVYRFGFGLPFGFFYRETSLLISSLFFCFFINFDLVYAIMGYPGLTALLIKKIRKKPYIVSLHGEIYKTIWLRRMVDKISFLREFYEKIYYEAAFVKAVSLSTASQVSYLGLKAAKIKIINNGVDLNKFRKLNVYRNSLRIITLSRFDKMKGLNYLIHAIPYVLKRHHNTEFVIVGDGNEKRNLENLIIKLGVVKSVKMAGWVEHKDLPQLLNSGNVFVLPSLSEGLSIVFLEAMACGLAVVGTNVGGIAELIKHRETGLLVPPANPRTIAEAIDLLLTNDKLRKKLTANALNFVKNFDWNIICRKMKQLFNEATINER